MSSFKLAGELLQELNSLDESHRIEAKLARQIDREALYAGHYSDSFDVTVLPDADISDIDANAIEDYRKQRRLINSAAEELGWSDNDLLRALGCLKHSDGVFKPTVAGILLEVRNPGHSIKAEEQLGEPGSATRNPRIAAILHEMNIAETKGSGIRIMREMMQAQGLLPPAYESSRRPDQFVATFLFNSTSDYAPNLDQVKENPHQLESRLQIRKES